MSLVNPENPVILSPSDLDSKRALLEKLLRQRASKPVVAPTSFAQQRLWFLDQLEPGTPLYNVNSAVRLQGPLDVDIRRRADGTPVVLEVNARFGANSAHAPEILTALLTNYEVN